MARPFLLVARHASGAAGVVGGGAVDACCWTNQRPWAVGRSRKRPHHRKLNKFGERGTLMIVGAVAVNERAMKNGIIQGGTVEQEKPNKSKNT